MKNGITYYKTQVVRKYVASFTLKTNCIIFKIQYSSRPSLQKTCVMLCALRNFEDNSHVELVQHEEYTACEQLLTS